MLFATSAQSQNLVVATERARAHLEREAAAFELSRGDVSDLLVRNAHVSARSGATYVHLAQHRGGIPIERAIVSVLVLPDGSIGYVGNRLLPDIADRMASPSPSISATDAAEIAVRHLDLEPREPLQVLERSTGPEQLTRISSGGVSMRPIRAQLIYFPVKGGDIPLTWEVVIEDVRSDHLWNIKVDAAAGVVLDQRDDTIHEVQAHIPGAAEALRSVVSEGAAHRHGLAGSVVEVQHAGLQAAAFAGGNEAGARSGESYRVFPFPFESPDHGATHTIVTSPINAATAATYPAAVTSWHDTTGDGIADFTDTRGNNVDAFLNRSGTLPPAPGVDDRPDGGATLTFDLAADLTQDPQEYAMAAVVNTFYWTNIVHNLIYPYGFTEEAGNFQVNNWGRGGEGGDPVLAHAQFGAVNAPGSNNCNANFQRQPDGESPRMRMYVCNRSTPWRDSDLDAGVILHEYAHGITLRLTGGAATASCIANDEQMGEGWSDWYALMFTQEAGHTIDTPRPIGSYLFNNAAGIRARPYSPDLGVNEFTYAEVRNTGTSEHALGHVWGTMIWDLNWALIGDLFPEEGGGSGGGFTSGFSTDFYSGTAGNNLALQLVTDALSIQPCSPGFVDARDAILAADLALTGGTNKRLIWKVFARRGLGFSATSNPIRRLDAVEAFDMPPDIKLPPVAVAAAPETLECDTEYGILSGTTVMLDGTGSYDPDFLNPDPDAVPLTYTWTGPFSEGGGTVTGETVEVTLPVGVHEITLEVEDQIGLKDTDQVTITIVDTLKPEITLLGTDPQVLECALGSYIDLGATATDQCDGSLTVVHNDDEVDIDNVGTYDVVYTATDAAGNEGSESRSVEVEDTTPPELTLAEGPFVLWPPRHQYVRFANSDMVLEATDACNTALGIDDVVVAEATSDEEERGQGDGSGATLDDILIASTCDRFSLRAERAGTGDGRVYRVHFAVDDGFNLTEADLAVHVPHHPERPVGEGTPLYTVEGCEPVAPASTSVVASADGSENAAAADSGDGQIEGFGEDQGFQAGDTGQSDPLPLAFELGQSYPNPMSLTAEINFELPDDAQVRIAVYDLLGREVRVLVDGHLTAGSHGTIFDGSDLPAGVYVYRMEAGNFAASRRLVLTR